VDNYYLYEACAGRAESEPASVRKKPQGAQAAEVVAIPLVKCIANENPSQITEGDSTLNMGSRGGGSGALHQCEWGRYLSYGRQDGS
jgi:hypothetical protein